MRLVLREIRGEQVIGEREFTGEVVRVGRDPKACDIFFDAGAWPMVSRLHAEFRWAGGRLFLSDNHSINGTFLDGRRVAEPVEVHPGARVLFGATGPALLVGTVEGDAEALRATQSHVAETDALRGAARQAPTRQAVLTETPQRPAPHKLAEAAPMPRTAHELSAQPFLLFEEDGGGQDRRVVLNSGTVSIGRDHDATVRIEADAVFVSRRHAEVTRRPDGSYALSDLKSFNGTLLNGQRITQPMPLFHGDRIQLGVGGPVLRFVNPAQAGPQAEEGRAQQPSRRLQQPSLSLKTNAMPAEDSGAARAADGEPLSLTTTSASAGQDEPAPGEFDGQSTMVLRRGSGEFPRHTTAEVAGAQAQLLTEVPFGGRAQLTVGRAAGNDIHLDGLQVSNRHARFLNTSAGVIVEDTGSANGVFVNGQRVAGRRRVQREDVIQIGPFVLRADPSFGVAVLDARSKTRIDAVDITQFVRNGAGRGALRVLDDVDLSIRPNEFVGLLGPSGAGKSVLMAALNGMRPPAAGRVLINDLELYKHLDSLKQSIGYVPQDDIIHRELTVYRTLYYVARLRLSRDVREEEIDQIIGEVLDVTGLSERRDVPVSQLSGGQRKRVSIAVELITKPSVIFLDEPTSGLDPATEDKIMKLFRQIAESGRTVIMTTHAMENVRLFDKVALLMRGRLVFYGAPHEALEFAGARSFKEIYDKLEAQAEAEAVGLQPPTGGGAAARRAYDAQCNAIYEGVAEQWRARFRQTVVYQRNVVEPLTGVERGLKSAAVIRRRATLSDMLRQWATLVRRYAEVLGRDRANLLILFGQAPAIALLTYLVVNRTDPRDFPFFVLALVAVWFGTSVAAREIVKERAIFRRERMFNLSLLPYVGSKFLVLTLIVGAQCALLFGVMKLLSAAGLMSLPGIYAGLPQLGVMILTGTVGVALGLFVSALVKTSEVATSLVPLILIPQILFSGLVGVPNRVTKFVGAAMPATWAFDELKRLSTLDTLREEGSSPRGPNRGRGLYKQVEKANDENIAKARAEVEDYKRQSEESLRDYEQKMKDYVAALKAGAQRQEPPPAPALAPPPAVPDAEKVRDDLSGYVSFMHPWGGVVLNPLVLCLMLALLLAATVVTLRAQDVRAR